MPRNRRGGRRGGKPSVSPVRNGGGGAPRHAAPTMAPAYAGYVPPVGPQHVMYDARVGQWTMIPAAPAGVAAAPPTYGARPSRRGARSRHRPDAGAYYPPHPKEPREYSPRCVTEFGAPLAIYPPPPPVAPGAAGRHNYYAATSPPEAKKRDRYTTTYNQGGTDFKFTTKAANVPSTPKSPRSQWATAAAAAPPPPRPLDAPAADSPVSPQSERSWRSVSPVLSPPGVLRSPRYRIKPGAYDQLFASSGGRDGDELPFALDGDDGDAGVSADDDGAVPAALIARFRAMDDAEAERAAARAPSPPPSLSSDDEDDAPPPPPPEPHPIWAGDSDSDDREVAGATARGWGPPGAETATFHKSTLFAHQALSKAPPVVVATPRADSKEMFAGDVLPSPRLSNFIGALQDDL